MKIPHQACPSDRVYRESKMLQWAAIKALTTDHGPSWKKRWKNSKSQKLGGLDQNRVFWTRQGHCPNEFAAVIPAQEQIPHLAFQRESGSAWQASSPSCVAASWERRVSFSPRMWPLLGWPCSNKRPHTLEYRGAQVGISELCKGGRGLKLGECRDRGVELGEGCGETAEWIWWIMIKIHAHEWNSQKRNKNIILKSACHCAPHPGGSFTFQYLVVSKWGQDTIKIKYMIVGLWPWTTGFSSSLDL